MLALDGGAVNKLLRGLLKLLFRCLGISIGYTRLILYLDVYRLPSGSLLLALSVLVADAAIHGVVHNAWSVKRVLRWLLLIGVGDDAASDYSKGRGVFRLSLLLKLRITLNGACHSIVNSSSNVSCRVLYIRRNIGILGKSASELRLVLLSASYRLTVLFWGVLCLRLLGHFRVLLLTLVGVLVLVLTICGGQCRALVY